MTLIENPATVERIDCDKPGCLATLVPPVNTRPYGALIQHLLTTRGWSVWLSRGRRYYCPSHTPDESKTKMRKVLPQ